MSDIDTDRWLEQERERAEADETAAERRLRLENERADSDQEGDR